MRTEILPVSRADYGELAAFLARFPGEPRPQQFWSERLAFWWDHNPASADCEDRGWILSDAGRIVGFIGVVPTLFQLAGQAARVFSGTTWRVLPEFRSCSLSLLMKQLAVANHSLLFATTPGNQSLPVRRAFGFQPLPGEISGQSVAVIDARAVLRHRLRHVRGAGVLSRALAPVLKAAGAVRADRSAATGVATALLSQAGDVFDDLWARTRMLFRNTNVRTAQWLNWYCFGCPGLPKTLIAAESHGCLVGYTIWRADDDQIGRFRRLECLDMWVDRTVPGAVAALVSAGIDHARATRVHAVAVSHFDEWVGKELESLGMWRMPTGQRQDYFRISPAFAGGVTAENSYFVAAQGDNGL